MPKYKVGAIYKLKKPFSDREDGSEAKRRYFLYLGNTSDFSSTTLFVYVATSTMQLAHFEHGGKNSASNFMLFKAGCYGFTDNCVICFDEIKTYMTEERFSSYEPEEKGQLDKEMLKTVYSKILESNKVSKAVKTDIHNCFNKIGVFGLKMPK